MVDATRVANRRLTSIEATARLEKFRPNAEAEKKPPPFLALLGKLWAPVPWMLAATIVFELGLGKFVECIVIAVMPVFNASLIGGLPASAPMTAISTPSADDLCIGGFSITMRGMAVLPF